MSHVPSQPNQQPKRDDNPPPAAARPGDVIGELPAAIPGIRQSIVPTPAPHEALSARDIGALITARDRWNDALSALAGAISFHPDNIQTLRTDEPSSSAELSSIEPDEEFAVSLLDEARGCLHPYKSFFIEWLACDEFFELATTVFPLPNDMPTEKITLLQIDTVGGPEFYQKIRRMLEPQESQLPKRRDLDELLGKIARFVGWEPTTTSNPNHTTQCAVLDQRLSLSDIKEIREALVTMLVLINHMSKLILPSSPPATPRLVDDADDESAQQ